MPVFSCGGMRYQFKWQDVPPEEIPEEGQANLEATIHRALELGINHIETARGYGSSEMQLGRVLPTLPRERLIVQTKVSPRESAQEFRETFEQSLSYLGLEHVDLLAFHGLNLDEHIDWILRPGGCMDAVRELQREGRVRFIGFSTHGPCSVITKAVETGEFDYMNLHWYFVNDTNWPAIEAAARQDMGVFIISPSDKGGRLYDPPAKLKTLCEPLSAMQFNDLYCLARPQVHTLSIGAARPTDFDDHIGALAYYDRIPEVLPLVEARLRAEIARVVGADWSEHWTEGIPEHYHIPGEMNVLDILRLWMFTKSLDLEVWARSRYNLLGHADHWCPGDNAGQFDEAALLTALSKSPFADRIPGILREAHALLGGEAQKRQSES